jgi:hypothetical protein
MKLDNYIKIVLSVIAVCLVLIVIELATLTPVGANNKLDVDIKAIGGRSIYNSIPVEITK